MKRLWPNKCLIKCTFSVQEWYWTSVSLLDDTAKASIYISPETKRATTIEEFDHVTFLEVKYTNKLETSAGTKMEVMCPFTVL